MSSMQHFLVPIGVSSMLARHVRDALTFSAAVASSLDAACQIGMGTDRQYQKVLPTACT